MKALRAFRGERQQVTLAEVIVAALREAGRPLSTVEIAVSVGLAKRVVSPLVSKLAAYGEITKLVECHGRARFYRWGLK